MAALPAEVAAHHGAVDGVVHCAGIIQPYVQLKELEDLAVDRVFAVNRYGTLNVTRALLPVLLEDLDPPAQGDELGVLGAGPAQLGIGRCLELLAPVPDGHPRYAQIGADRLR